MIKLYYWKDGTDNFGDYLSPVVVAHVSGQQVKTARKPADADLVAIGSLYHHLPQFFGGAIWGTGAIDGRSLPGFPGARTMAVRGPLSTTTAGAPASAVHGDPGLFCAELWTGPLPKKRYALGLIPHLTDMANPRAHQFVQHLGRCIIHPNLPPRLYMRAVLECRAIVSTSLHGIITADAFGVPNTYCQSLSGHVIGGDWKFRDYWLGVRRKGAPTSLLNPVSLATENTTTMVDMLTAQYVQPDVTGILQALREAFPC